MFVQQFLFTALALCFIYYLFVVESTNRCVRYFGAVILCYGLGSLLGFAGNDYFRFVGDFKIAEACLLLALPLLLLSTSIQGFVNSFPNLMRAFIFSILSVSISVIVLGQALSNTPTDATIFAGVAAIFTGGTANLSSLFIAIDMERKIFNQIFTCDLITGAIYLIVCLRFSRKNAQLIGNQKSISPEKQHLQPICLLYLSYSLLMVGACTGISFVIFRAIQSTFIIVALTVGSILLGQLLSKNTHSQDGSRLGEFLLLAFCFFVGTQMNLQDLQSDLLTPLIFFGGVLVVNSALYFSFCKLMKISFAETWIAHIAAIFGPPFVIIIAKNIGRRDLIAPGIALGSIGVGIGTFLGIFVYKLLLYSLAL